MVTKLDKKAEDVVQLLLADKLFAATAESCTGGLLSASLTAVSGSSGVFGFGVCSYANEAKIRLLGVKPETLEEFGAVSLQTAQEMALGVRRISGADFGLSTTGIAGPGGATAENPVGTVWIGVSSERKTFAKRFVFSGEMFSRAKDKREAIRLEAVYTALTLLEEELSAQK